jgi:hypothetical protein
MARVALFDSLVAQQLIKISEETRRMYWSSSSMLGRGKRMANRAPSKDRRRFGAAGYGRN